MSTPSAASYSDPVSCDMSLTGSLKFEDALESQFQFACRVTVTREMLIHTAYTFEASGALVPVEEGLSPDYEGLPLSRRAQRRWGWRGWR